MKRRTAQILQFARKEGLVSLLTSEVQEVGSAAFVEEKRSSKLGVKRVGFFGGTFDPIHFGHLNLAINILEKHRLDHIFFSPANFSPEKHDELPTSPKEARKAMTELAIAGIPQFSLLTLEMDREGPSYTIDTVKYLLQKYPKDQFHLILGEDTLIGLPKWKEVEQLLKIAPPLIGSRPGAKIPKLPVPIREAIDKGKTEIAPMDISSTDLRRRLSQKKYCGHLIPAKVLDYIQSHRLY